MSFILSRLLSYAWPLAAAAGVAMLGVIGVQAVRLAGEKADHADTLSAFSEHRRLAERASRIQSENFAAQSSAWRATQLENSNANRAFLDELLRDNASLRAAGDRLQLRADQLRAAASQSARDPGTQPAGPPAQEAADLLATMLSRVDEAAGGIAEFADRANAAGELCARDYDALKR